MSMSSHHTCSSRSLIIDTDVGFDDLVAVSCLLKSTATLTAAQQTRAAPPSLLITTVGGVISASRGAATLREFFPTADADQRSIIAAGLDSPVMPYDPLPAWLSDYRSTTLDAFQREMNHTSSAISATGDTNGNGTDTAATSATSHDVNEALSRVVDVVDNCPKDSLDILCIGPLTNLAHWLDHYENTKPPACTTTTTCTSSRASEDFFASKIHSIFILGGNHPTMIDGNNTLLNEPPEFNFGLDPEAARSVLESPHLSSKIHLVTSSVCNMERLNSVLGGKLLHEFVEEQKKKATTNPGSTTTDNSFYKTLLKFDTNFYSLSCDPVIAYTMRHPDCVEWERVPVHVEVPSGKLIPSISDCEDNKKEGSVIRIASDIDLTGYLSWIDLTVHSSIYVR